MMIVLTYSHKLPCAEQSSFPLSFSLSFMLTL